jgi:TonB family protein
LDRLESGFLMFETPRGLVRAELSLRQRIYLLWTFRNFRQLPVPLLNPRQRALINSVFHNHADVVSHLLDPSLVIGVVENFVPPAVPIDFPAPVQRPAESSAQEPARSEERQEQVVARPAEIAPQPNRVSWSSPGFVWPKIIWPKFVWPNFAWGKLRKSKLRMSKLRPSGLRMSKLRPSGLTLSRLTLSGLTMSRLATTLGALSVCIISVGAWHRMQTVPSSQAHDQTRLQQIAAITVPDSPRPAELATIAENPTVSVPPAASARIAAAKEAGVIPASIAAEVPVRTSAPIPTSIPTPSATPKRTIRIHHAASTPTPNLAFSSPDSSIQASRPPLRFAYPIYPDIRARGVVSLTAGVDSDGAVRTVRVVSGNRTLAAAAVRAVRQWRYRPYLKDGQPVATETNIVISFFADDAISMSFPPSIPTSR